MSDTKVLYISKENERKSNNPLHHEESKITIDMVSIQNREENNLARRIDEEECKYVIDKEVKLNNEIVNLYINNVTEQPNCEAKHDTKKKYVIKNIYNYMYRPPHQQGFPPQQQGWWGPQPPVQGPPSQGYPPQGYPPQGYPPQGYPPQGPPLPESPPQRQFVPIGPPLAYTPETRNYFVRYVLILVLIMLLMTAGFLAFVLATPSVKDFFNRSGWIVIIPAFIVLMCVDYAMICSPCSRVPPCNFICLFITVVAMSLITAKITAHYQTKIVLYAALATAAVVFVCVLLACSNFDFTSWMLYVVAIGTAFGVIAMIVIITMALTHTMIKPLLLVILAVGTLIQVVMLIIQLQTILGGKSIELSEDDYALGAFMLYTSVIDIFIKMVQIIGISDSS